MEQVLQRTDLVDFAGGYTQLAKRGAEFTGRCPFHDERTPSFWVNGVKGVYHCFGCGASGDAIGFVRDKLGLEFVEAVELLADRYRVELEHEPRELRPGQAPPASTARVDKRRLFEVLDAAASFYARYLAESPEAAEAREYLASRGVDAAAVESFRLGFSPDAPHGMSSRARTRGFTAKELADARLTGRQGTDFFRGRLMVPIIDRADRVIGFGARKLREEQFGGKYLNSADGPVFHKSRALFAAPDVRKAAQDAGCVVVVEGYMDVIAMWQGGFGNAVAAMGTSLTAEQVTELKRLAPRAVFCFDADAAGQAATLRALAAARAQQLDVRVVALVDGDPADVLGEPTGKARMRELLDAALPLLEYRVGALLAASDLGSGPGRNEAYERALRLFAQVSPSPERSEQVARVVDRLGLDRTFAQRLERATAAPVSDADRERERTREGGGDGPPAPPKRPLLPAVTSAADRTERLLLAAAYVLSDDGQLAEVADAVQPDHFASDLHREAWTVLAAAGATRVDLAALRGADDDGALVALFAELSALRGRDHLDGEGVAISAFDELAGRLELLHVERELRAVRAELGRGPATPELQRRRTELEHRRRQVDPRLREVDPATS